MISQCKSKCSPKVAKTKKHEKVEHLKQEDIRLNQSFWSRIEITDEILNG